MASRRDHKTIRLKLVEFGGNVSAVAEHFNVARQTVYNWIERYNLRDVVEDTRDKMFDTAERNISLAVEAGSLDASKFVLTHMPVQKERRWSSRQELTGEGGAPLNLSPDVIALLEARGMSLEEIKAEIEAEIRDALQSPDADDEDEPGAEA